MFDGNFRTGVDKLTQPVGERLVRMGISADGLTILGVFGAVGAAVAIGTGRLHLGLGLLIASALPDLLDGPVAKASGTQTVRGAFFDSVADRAADSLVLGGIAWYVADIYSSQYVVLPLAILGASQLLSYMRAKAELHGFRAKGGIMERAERVIAITIGLAFPQVLIQVLWITLALTSVTVVQRFTKVWRQATDASPVLVARRQEMRSWARRFTLWDAESDEQELRRRTLREWTEQRRQHRRKMRQGS